MTDSLGRRCWRSLAAAMAASVMLCAMPAVSPAQTDKAGAGVTLPKTIERFVDAVNRGDTAAFLAFFPEDGVVDDWGRKFVGHSAIRSWSDKEFIGAKGRMTIATVRQDGAEISVAAGWKSNFYSGDSRFVFVLDGERIREMRISSGK
jgi:hypothetical protein